MIHNSKRESYFTKKFIISILLLFLNCLFIFSIPLFDGEKWFSLLTSNEKTNEFNPTFLKSTDNIEKLVYFYLRLHGVPEKYMFIKLIKDYIQIENPEETFLVLTDNTVIPISMTGFIGDFYHIMNLLWVKVLWNDLSMFNVFRSIILDNTILVTVIALVFYMYLDEMGISSNKIKCIFSAVFLLSTGFIIYARSLYVNSFSFAFFAIISSFLILFRKDKKEVLAGIAIGYSIPLLLFGKTFFSNGVITSATLLAYPAAISLLVIIKYFDHLSNILNKLNKPLVCAIMLGVLASLLFVYYIYFVGINSRYAMAYNPEELMVYGMHRFQDGKFIYGEYPFTLYVSRYFPRNGVFLPGLYQFFYHLFSERGIITNSPYLMFSFMSLVILIKRRPKKYILLTIFIALYILFFSYYPGWYGGASPRYDRFMLTMCFYLSGLSFYFVNYLLNNEIIKNNFIKYLLFLIWIFTLYISISNSISLSMRLDWRYWFPFEAPTYDSIILPWITPNYKVYYDLSTKYSLIESYIYNSISEIPMYFSDRLGLITDISLQHNTSGMIHRKVILSNEYRDPILEVYGCSGFAGGDGVISYINITTVNASNFEISFFEPNTCKRIFIPFPKNATSADVYISIIPYMNVSEEWIQWKYIVVRSIMS